MMYYYLVAILLMVGTSVQAKNAIVDMLECEFKNGQRVTIKEQGEELLWGEDGHFYEASSIEGFSHPTLWHINTRFGRTISFHMKYTRNTLPEVPAGTAMLHWVTLEAPKEWKTHSMMGKCKVAR